MFYKRFVELCSEKGITQAAAVQNIGLNRAAINKWKKGSIPQGKTVSKLAEQFGVSVDYLLNGEEPQREPSQKADISDDDVKVALFGGDGEVTPEMWEEVRRFAEYVKAREQSRKDNGSK